MSQGKKTTVPRCFMHTEEGRGCSDLCGFPLGAGGTGAPAEAAMAPGPQWSSHFTLHTSSTGAFSVARESEKQGLLTKCDNEEGSKGAGHRKVAIFLEVTQLRVGATLCPE